MTKIHLAAPMQIDSLVDGEGLRIVIWCQGCDMNCKNCHNPETHNFKGGKTYEVEQIIKKISQLKDDYDGITFSGGQPLLQIEACLEIAKYCKSQNINIWLYSGYTYEEIIKDPLKKSLLEEVDVLVDGRYIDELRDPSLPFRGSSNQRVIDVQKSLQMGFVVLYLE